MSNFGISEKNIMLMIKNKSYSSGFSLIVVLIFIAVISSIVLPMARITVIEEKISQNHDWLNMAYAKTQGEVYMQSQPEGLITDSVLPEVLSENRVEQNSNLPEHTTEVKYIGDHGIPMGYSLSHYTGYQFDVVTAGDMQATGSYNRQIIGITYAAKK